MAISVAGLAKNALCPGQVDYLSGKKSFYSHAPNCQVVCQPNKKKVDLDLLSTSKIGELLIQIAS